tara:strand:+ start:304 stop:597 length:294 start_codon:yes stop_codon:yes gene_type:complete
VYSNLTGCSNTRGSETAKTKQQTTGDRTLIINDPATMQTPTSHRYRVRAAAKLPREPSENADEGEGSSPGINRIAGLGIPVMKRHHTKFWPTTRRTI